MAFNSFCSKMRKHVALNGHNMGICFCFTFISSHTFLHIVTGLLSMCSLHSLRACITISLFFFNLLAVSFPATHLEAHSYAHIRWCHLFGFILEYVNPEEREMTMTTSRRTTTNNLTPCQGNPVKLCNSLAYHPVWTRNLEEKGVGLQ